MSFKNPPLSHHRSGEPLLTEIYADPGYSGFYYRERKPDSVAKYIRMDLIPPTNEELLEENAELKRQIERFSDPSKAKLVSFEGGEFQFEAPIVTLMAEYLAQMLEVQGHEVSNYCQISVNHDRLGELTLLLQRKNGKTPHQLKKEAEEKLALKEEQLATVLRLLKDAVHESDTQG